MNGHPKPDLRIAAPTVKPPERGPRFPLRPFGGIVMGAGPRYRVKGLIPREGLVVAYGPPKCGKSFVVFDMAMHIALGWDYRGRSVQPGVVVYAALEGSAGFEARVEAFRQHRMAEAASPPPFYLMTAPLKLAADVCDLVEDIKAQLSALAPAVVVLDTLNRSFVGSENDDKDMGRFIAAADAIRAAFDCVVIVIHHSGLAGDRPRGHTALGGAADAQLAMKKTADGLITMTVEWMKDGPEGDQLTSRLRVVEVGTDDDGEPVNSCIVEPVDDTPSETHGKKGLSRRLQLGLVALQDAVADKGSSPPPGLRLPKTVRCVSVQDWRSEVYARGILERDARNPREDFRRLKLGLMERGIIAERNDQIWIV